MKVFWDNAQLQHAPRFFLQRGQLRANLEVPARAHALLEGVRALGLATEPPRGYEDDAFLTVHTGAYLDFLRTAARDWAILPDAGPEVVANVHPSPEMLAQGAQPGGSVIARAGWFMADTACPVGPGTWPAVRAAACCALAAADAAADGGSAYALTRPPGHHAYPARAGGHCFLNNAALAAERLRAAGACRVAVLDIDSHHGNGTQGAFWDRGDVFVASLHGDPSGYYPWFVGHAAEGGIGSGEGCNLNLPLPRASGDEAWLEAIDTALAAISRFGPEALVLSLGFDASKHEPLNYLAVSADAFARAGARIAKLGRPTAIVQEGGYNTDTIGSLLHRFFEAYGS